MKVLALNGSPRKKWNTATLLENALEGAASEGAKTELIHLYDLNFTGCTSCFACKTLGGSSYGRCAVKDDLRPVLKKMDEVDALILGSPIYIGTVTGEMKSFLERLVFPYISYTAPPEPIFTRKVRTAFIYTMNAPEMAINEFRSANIAIDKLLDEGVLPAIETFQATMQIYSNEFLLKMVFGSSESLLCCDTYQFEDYSKVVATLFDPQQKAQRRKEVFPKDCEKAFELGVRFAEA